MIRFPNAKINLGLQIVEKRADGFHNLETVFYPVQWCDALEVLPAHNKSNDHTCTLITTGLTIAGDPADNLLVKAYNLLSKKKELPSLDVHLHKEIPMGAGLGGGSADAAFFMQLLNETFAIGLTPEELQTEAAKLGSDCAFFIRNEPVYATGKGDQLEPLTLSLHGYKLLIVYPDVHSNTALAYSRVIPEAGRVPVKELITKHSPEAWRHLLVNDFEPSVFYHHPAIAALKQQLYDAGAIYASLSGSGSSVFGIFKTALPPGLSFPAGYKVFAGGL